MKKEKYLTLENCKEKTAFWYKLLEGLRGTKVQLPLKISGNAGLIVIDLQKYFTEPQSHAFVPSIDVVIYNITRLVEQFKKRIYTRHIDLPDTSMCKWWGDGLFENDDFSHIDERVKPSGTVIVKHTYSAFKDTELEKLLREKNVERVYISGVLTNLCCETTARDAFNHGFEVFFIADATATYTEEFHVATLRNLAHGFARIVTTDTVLEWRACGYDL
ncbi:MAG: isochorismatase family protein [Thermoplasmata archaeon]